MCIFCQIASNEIPSYKIYEDDLFLAFLDISQATKGHTLIIPKKEYKNIFEMDDNTLSKMAILIKKISIALKKSLNIDGLNILNNNEAVAGQTVYHFHVHLIPRYNNDNVEIHLPNNIDNLKEKDYKEIQNKIKEYLK